MSESGYGYRHQERGIAVSINLAAIHQGSKCNNLSFKSSHKPDDFTLC